MEDASSAQCRRRNVSWRGLLIGLLLIPLNAYWLVTVEMVRGNHYPTSVSLFFNAVFSLLVVVLLNAPLRRWFPRWALTPGELATIYILTSLGSATAGVDWAGLTSVMSYPAQYASPENRWGELILPGLPKHLMILDKTAVTGFWTGRGSLYDPANYGPWIRPLLWWLLFVGLLCTVFLAQTSLLRRRWIEVERLSYPIVQLPMAMVATPERLLGSRAFWLALCGVAALDVVNGLHILWPAVPEIAVRSTASPAFQIGGQIVDSPWNAIGFLAVAFYPFIIGIGMLIPLELSFSCCFFYLAFKAQYVVAKHLGLLQGAFPYPREQSLGAYLGLILFSLWLSRRHLRQVVREALAGREVVPGREPMPYRTALVLGALCFGAIIWFAHSAGLAPWFAVTWFSVYLLLSLSFTRIRAEMGIPSHEMHYIGPGQILPRVLGTRICGAGNMVSSYAFYWFNYGQRCHPAPHIAEGHRLAETTNVSPRSLSLPMLGAMLLGMACCSWATLHSFYQSGAGTEWTGHQSFWIPGYPATELASNLSQPTGFNGVVAGAVAVGLVVAVSGLAGYTRIGWWPLHPIGYAVSSAWAMEHMWFALFVAWAIKLILIRYGGTHAQRRAAPFAMGLILGDFLVGSIWSLLGMFRRMNPYSIWP